MTNQSKQAVLESDKGFTLIELLVALAVFVVLVVLSINVFLGGLEAQRKNTSLQLVEEEARYALELIGREVRMSSIMTSSGLWPKLEIVASKAAGSEGVRYELADGQILRNGQAITSEKIEISQLTFYVDNPEGVPGKVTITMTAEIKSPYPERKAQINLETTISSRNYQVYGR